MKHANVPVTLTAASQAWTYDGQAHANDGVSITEGELLEGDSLVAHADGSVTNVKDTAESNNPVRSYRIMHGSEDVTDSYDVKTVPGTLTINKKKAVVKAQDKAFVYDGEEKSWGGYDVSGLVGNDEIYAVTKGTIRYPGRTVANTIANWQFV